LDAQNAGNGISGQGRNWRGVWGGTPPPPLPKYESSGLAGRIIWIGKGNQTRHKLADIFTLIYIPKKIEISQEQTMKTKN
jgi:hypothetical protein